MSMMKTLVENAILKTLSESSEKIVSKKLPTHAYDAAHADAHEFKQYMKDEHGVHAQLHYHGKPGQYNHDVTHITYHGPAHAVKSAVAEHHAVEDEFHGGDDDYKKEVAGHHKALLKTPNHPDVEKMNEKEHKEAEAYKSKHS